MLKIILGIFFFLTSSTSYSEENNPLLIGWVGFWNEEMIEWAENENRVSKLCPETFSIGDQKKCKQKYLSEKYWSIHTYNQPNANSEKIGEIVVTVKPGNSLKTTFKSDSGETIEFLLDLYDQDWGYGPYLHQTIIEQKGDWIKIPIPGTHPYAWINPRRDIQYLDIFSIMPGTVYNFGTENIVIVEVSGNTVKYRLENEFDMWCDIGRPPKISARKIIKLNIKDFFKNGHLRIDLTYKRGC